MSDPNGTSGSIDGGKGDVTAHITRWRFWYFLLAYPWWRRHSWTLTSSGIVSCKGLLSRDEKRLPYSRIDDKAIKQGLIGRIFNVGTITLETAGERSGQMILAQVGDVERFYDELCARVDRAYERLGAR